MTGATERCSAVRRPAISAVTPSVLQTDANPAGVPQAAFEGLQAQLAANRSEFYRAVPSGPFYNFDQPGVTASEADSWPSSASPTAWSC